MKELIPGEDDQSVYEIFVLLTQSGNCWRARNTLAKAEYHCCVAESLAEKKARGRQPPDSFCCRAAPTCVLEASVTSNTSTDGEGCVRDTAEVRVDLALSKAS